MANEKTPQQLAKEASLERLKNKVAADDAACAAKKAKAQ